MYLLVSISYAESPKQHYVGIGIHTEDVEYVENMSFFLDLKILLKTAQKVLKGSDVILMQGPMLPFDQYRRIQQKNSGLKK